VVSLARRIKKRFIMCFKNYLRKILCKPVSLPKPNNLESIDVSEINTIIKAAYPDVKLFLTDTDYKTTSKEELQRFLAYDITDTYPYVSQYYDCDDFSFSLMGGLSNPEWGSLSFGILWVIINNTAAHALNIFIDKDREIWMVEPQTDIISEIPSTYKPYLIMI